jgi:nitrate/nitrite-specific signal transduction histidine kinase
MPAKPRLIVTAEKPAVDTKAQATLREIVREALLNVLKDESASAAAKASAGRTLLQFFTDDSGLGKRRGADMTAAELDAALAQLGE